MKILRILIVLVISVLVISCEDVLSTKTVEEWNDNTVWNIPELAEGVLLQIYSEISGTPDNFSGNFLDAATDNAVTNDYTSGVYKIGTGGISKGDNPISNWGTCYDKLQHLHLFMEKGLRDDLLYDRTNAAEDAAIKNRLKGEVFFLRAWLGFELLQRYGGRTTDGEALGYPIVTHFITDEEGRHPEAFTRNTYAECVKQIVADCDSAMERLPLAYTGDGSTLGVTKIGRATASAAEVLKSKVALYSASPAFQSSEVVTINGMGDFAIINPTSYQKSWEYAALVSDTILKSEGFETFIALTAKNLADAPNVTPADFVFRKFFNSNAMEGRHFPPFYRGSGKTAPSQNLVDAFPASDGYPIGKSGVYDADFPYEKRDKRLDLNIYYQGRVFGANDTNIDVVAGGKDSQTFHKDASRTGFYLAKFMSTKKDMLAPIQKLNSVHYYPLLRRAEVFINFAEASNEAWGPKVKGPKCKYSAYDVVKMIRQKSGGLPAKDPYLEEMAQDKDKFRQLIQNERRLEFAFENHRYFDMRRWLLPLNEDIKGVTVTRDAQGVLSYEEKFVEKRNLNDIRYYYLPIPHAEILKNPNLKNNIGWD